jgi:D-alanyl-D-alanine carboxypeptidase/D-alanyl-D-alanine-endopeptidase (penicillin-binding protein 4)
MRLIRSLIPVVAPLALAVLTVGGAQAQAISGATVKTPVKAPVNRVTPVQTIHKPVNLNAPLARTPASGRASRKPILSRRPTSADALRADLANLIDISTASGQWGVMVVSLSTGDTLFSREADLSLNPASTMKLFTSAVALERFGPAHQFETEVLRDGSLTVDGVVEGNLILKGAGDPSLAPRYAGWTSGVKPMDALAQQVVNAGVRRVRGDVIGDASAYDNNRVPDGWKTRYLQAGYAARVSALSFNENIAHIRVRVTDKGARVDFAQPVSGLSIRSTVTVRPNIRGAHVRVWQDTVTDAFRVSGWIGSLSPARVYQVVVEQPERFGAAAFRAALEARGVSIDGRTMVGAASPTAERITSWASAPLAQLVATMNGESNNHFAELLFRNASRSGGGVASAAGANESLRAFLADRVGVQREAVFAADGSGLSTLDRITPRALVQLLGYSAAAPWGAVLDASLPVAGRTETLKTRMRRTAAQGNLRGKTGTTNEVASLGGYVTAANGEALAFAFIYNGRDLWRARAAIDAMGVTLASFER